MIQVSKCTMKYQSWPRLIPEPVNPEPQIDLMLAKAAEKNDEEEEVVQIEPEPSKPGIISHLLS